MISYDTLKRLCQAVAFIWAMLALLVPFAGGTETSWPQFRGPTGRGVAQGEDLPSSWSTTENVAWKTSVPGRGWSSPIVYGNRVFLTSVASEATPEKPKKGLYFGGERPKPEALHHWKVHCLDLQTGDIVWSREVHRGTPKAPTHLKNTYASETPVTDGEHVYAYFGNVGIFCLDSSTGKRVWSRQWKPFKMRNGWGTASSPALHDGRLYIVHDNEEQSFIMALDKATGERLWRRERNEPSNWATPFVWEKSKRTEIITNGKNKVRSYSLDGELLWSFDETSSIVIPTPFAYSGLLYVCSGYVGDNDRPIVAFQPGAEGDLSPKPDEPLSRSIKWYQPQAAPYNPSPIAYRGNLYVLFDSGFLTCHDSDTGDYVYGKQRLNKKGSAAFTASPWAYDGKIFCLSESGKTYVIEAGSEYNLLHTNELNEMCMATPAIAGKSLLIRTLEHLYCIRNPSEALP